MPPGIRSRAEGSTNRRLAATRGGGGGRVMLYRYLLVVRFALVNLVAAALLAAAYMQGWLDGLFAERLRELSGTIFLVFLYGLALCGLRVWQQSIELNNLKAGSPNPESRIGQYLDRAPGASPESRSLQAGVLRLKLTDRIVAVRHIANALVFLGLIGTVIGFIIALSGVDPESAAKAENVTAMVATLIGGMSVALYTTLVGGVLYIWLIVNHRILTTGTVSLIAAVIELRDAHGNA